MASPITDYASLQSAVKNYLVYDDVNEFFDLFLGLAEARLNREIRIREMRANSGDLTANASSEISIPSGLIEIIDFYETGENGGTLDYLAPQKFWSLKSSRSGSAQPAAYTIDGTTIYLTPLTDSTSRVYRIDFYKELTGLSATNTTNSLLTKAPDVYLYAVLLCAQPYLADPARQSEFAAMYENSRQSLLAADTRSRYRPGVGNHIRSFGVTPDGEFRIP